MTATRRRGGLGTPALVVPFGAVGLLFLLLPTAALLIRTPWGSLGAIYRDEHVWTALRISLTSSLEATAASLLFGVPLAWMLARLQVPGIGVARAVVTIPLSAKGCRTSLRP